MAPAAFALFLTASLAPSSEGPTLAEILERAGEYVTAFEHDASGVVLEESYRQSLRRGSQAETRFLSSEVVLVALPGETGLFGFRDVVQVNGRTLADRDERLQKLFLHPSEEGRVQAEAILDESARFNLGSTVRNFNLPTLVLGFLRPPIQPRFTFRDRGKANVSGRLARRVAYEEHARPTLIRDPTRDEDQVAQGTLVLDEETGAVLRTELHLDNARARTQVTVDYRWVDTLELWLPGEMTESYEGPGGAPGRVGGFESITTAARYSKPRRFGVTTEETITPPKEETP